MSDTLLRSPTLPKWTARLKPEIARKRVFQILEGQATDARARGVTVGLTVLISLNILAVILESMPGLGEQLEFILAPFEALSVTVFTVEYALRLWSCSPEPLYRKARARFKYAMTPLALVDLAVILPAYLPWELFVDLRFARVLRLVRIFRLFKVARYSKAVRMFLGVLTAKRADLGRHRPAARDHRRPGLELDVLRRVPGTARGLPEHSRGDVVVGPDSHHGRLWGHVPGHSRRSVAGDRHRPRRDRLLRPARGHPGDGFRGGAREGAREGALLPALWQGLAA